MDSISRENRSRNMARIRSVDTKPEMMVRQLIHGMGYRYRLHNRRLPGHPDLVFSSRRKVIFVHGCFWHRHSCRRGKSMPSTRTGFWKTKLEGNRKRDRQVRCALQEAGWEVLIIWECQVKATTISMVAKRIKGFLEGE